MNLGVLIPEFPSQTHVFFWREIIALRRLGVSVHILSTRRPNETCPHPFAVPAAMETHYLYPPTLAVAASLARSPGRLAKGLRYVASLTEGAGRRLRVAALMPCAEELVIYARRLSLDHVHVHSCADAAHVAALARVMGGPRYSLHLHGDLVVYGTDHRQKCAGAAFVAAAARPMRDQIIEQVSLPLEQTCTLTMGVDTDRFTPPASSVSAADGSLRLITVARLNAAKGHHVALEALRIALDKGARLHYSIVGSGPHGAQIAADIERLTLQEHVSCLGSLGEDAVLDRLQASDVFVLPTSGIGEASPVAVMEAMACGLAVIATRVGGVADMISPEVDGILVDAKDPSRLADAFCRLWSNADLRRSIGVAARRRAVEQFDCVTRARIFLQEIERTRPSPFGRAGVAP